MCTLTELHPVPSTSLEVVLKTKKNNDGGNFTLRSKKTQKDFTYKIKRSEFKGNWYTQIFVETQYLDFKYLGNYANGHVQRHGQTVDSDTANAVSWLLRQVEKSDFQKIQDQCDLFHTNHCLRCGRELTDANSIEIGLGPVCRSIV